MIDTTSDKSWLAWFCLAYVEFNEGHFDQTVDFQTRAYEIGETLTDRWDPLFHQGRSMTSAQIVDTARDELQTVG